MVRAISGRIAIEVEIDVTRRKKSISGSWRADDTRRDGLADERHQQVVVGFDEVLVQIVAALARLNISWLTSMLSSGMSLLIQMEAAQGVTDFDQ